MVAGLGNGDREAYGFNLISQDVARINGIVICNPLRSPIGISGGVLRDTPATDPGASVIRALVDRFGLDDGLVDALVMGQVVQAEFSALGRYRYGDKLIGRIASAAGAQQR